MKPFDVYPIFNIEPVRGEGSYVFDKNGTKYLDLYGGHAVISIGHSHPHYVERITEQLSKLGFYSNSVQIPIQQELAGLLGEMSGYEDYSLFLCNSGAEAVENALKIASFHNDKKKVIAFKRSFHGRTSAAVAVTDNPTYSAPINKMDGISFCEMNDIDSVVTELERGEVAAVIIEGIQGLGGVFTAADSFLRDLSIACKRAEAVLILDEIQSGYGRTGRFFAHQYAGITPDLITVAKGMGNGFPIGGVLISPAFKAVHGMLGTTFGGSHLACAAGLAVLEVIQKDSLIQHAEKTGQYMIDELLSMGGIDEVRGRGLLVGIQLDRPAAEVRRVLLEEHKIFTGSSAQKETIRLLPALNIGTEQLDQFLTAFKKVLRN